MEWLSKDYDTYNNGFIVFNFVPLFKILSQHKNVNQMKTLLPKFKHFQDYKRIDQRNMKPTLEAIADDLRQRSALD